MGNPTGMSREHKDRNKESTFGGIRGIVGLTAGIILLASTSPALAMTTIKILSPKSGATVSQKVSVKYAYHKEGRANHVHVFVDGNFSKATADDPVKLTLDKGHHTIMLRAASRHHDLLKARASVDVDVK